MLEERLSCLTNYVHQIAEGNLKFNPLHGITTDDKEFYALLSKARDKLKTYSLHEEQRNWIAEGMSRFMEILQGSRTNEGFYNTVLTMIVRYTQMAIGGIFILNDMEGESKYLELKACYARDQNELNKRIVLGEGLVGQCFIEKEIQVFSSIPANYLTISSGLGEAHPRYLILIPLVCNNQALGVIELASFQQLEQYQMELIMKIAESLASVIMNTQQAVNVSRLYEQSQNTAKRLLEQEEILHRNIETLQSTQDAMKRNQLALHQQSQLMKFIIDNVPFPIFVKDEKSKYTLVNKSEAKLFNLEDSELLGKDDSCFVASDEEWQVIKESDMRVLSSDEPIELPIQHFTTATGSSYIFKTTKIPFINPLTGKKNILGVSIDLTQQRVLEQQLLNQNETRQVDII